MAEALTLYKPHTVGLIDLGTNSMRLLVVRIESNGSYAVLSEQKESVRLGEGVFPRQTIRGDVLENTVLVGARFADMARSFHADPVIAVATSATRDARNRHHLLDRFRQATDVNLRVISGREEARLIYLGVASGANLGDDNALFLDIGGGSTEIIIGDQHQHEYLDTLKLGAIRLTNRFFESGDKQPIPRSRYETIRRHVRSTAVRTIQSMSRKNFSLTMGSSGTIMTLGDIAARQFLGRPLEKNDSIAYAHLRKVIMDLCDMNLDERLKVPGMSPRRADILIAGAAILDTLMEALAVTSITISDRSLRHGLLIEHLLRTGEGGRSGTFSYRMDSVIRLGRQCRFDEDHARHVAHLALELFDSLKKAGLHSLGTQDRSLLEYAALLHDIGVFLSYDNHPNHSYYFIRHAELLGFDDTEITIVATIAMFHRKTYPRKKHPEFASLEPCDQEAVRILCVLLRIAESLDRSHSRAVHHARIFQQKNLAATLEIETDPGTHLEQWVVQTHMKAFTRTFGTNVRVAFTTPGNRVGS